MNQLVELGKHAEDFTKANTDVIAVFREEKEGEKGLEKIKKNTKTPYILALDNGNKKTGRYSPGKKEFSGYVINKEGEITKVFEGNLRNRAKSAELLTAIAAANGSAKNGSATKGSETKGSATKGSETKGSAKKGSATKGSGSK